MSANKEAISFKSPRETVSLLILTTFLCVDIVRLTSKEPSKGIESFSSVALNKGLSLSKIPSTVAFSSPCLIISEAALSPRSKPIQSIIKLLPAPVSPVKTVRPLLRSNSISSMIAKF